jgi:LysW-gamma-L-lysine/LysW-L-ornithine aminotransferase
MFACQHFGLKPDIMCVAKSIAGGLPMGAVLLGEKIDNIQKQSHGSTFGGNPVACAAALAAIDYIDQQGLPQRAAELGSYAISRLRDMNLEKVREVRGMGLMIGIELTDKVTPYLRELMYRGVLALPAGPNVLRLLPPLVIERDDLDFAIEQIHAVLS